MVSSNLVREIWPDMATHKSIIPATRWQRAENHEFKVSPGKVSETLFQKANYKTKGMEA
jgi:hypothetical protein